nr:hypothetical protein [Tanacetum cinerariifolium]
MENLFGTQAYYVGQGSGGTQDYYVGQDYSTGLGSGMGGPSDLVEEESLVEEADGYGEEVQKVRPVGRDRAKKKATSSSRY